MNESVNEWIEWVKNGEQMHRFIPITPGKDVLSHISKADGQEIFIEPEFFFLQKEKFFKEEVHDRFLLSHFSEVIFKFLLFNFLIHF